MKIINVLIVILLIIYSFVVIDNQIKFFYYNEKFLESQCRFIKYYSEINNYEIEKQIE